MGKFKNILQEIFFTTIKLNDIDEEYFDGPVEVYKNPTKSELSKLYKLAYDNGVRIGVDNKYNIYVWIEDVMHFTVEKKLKMQFKMRLEYIKNRNIIWISSSNTQCGVEKYLNDDIKAKLKKTFPKAKTIEMRAPPYKKFEL